MNRVLDFVDHRRDLGANRYVYAVASRRARGLSIGINLNPDKVCNFDCPYCQVDRTVPGAPPDVDLVVLASELDDLLARVEDGSLWRTPPFDTVAPVLRRVADIAFAGDGEPTTPASFPGAVAAVRKVRDRRGLQRVPIRLLTNATMLHRDRVRAGLSGVDEVWCKLDAGTPERFALVDGTQFPFPRVLSNLKQLARERPIVLQSMFFALDGAPPSEAELDAWRDRIAEILAAGGRVDQVQVYTVARKPANPQVSALPREALDAIAARVRALGVPAEIYA